jgi:hypothetical protein
VDKGNSQPVGFRQSRCSGTELGLALSFKGLQLLEFWESAACRKQRDISGITAAETAR